MGAGDMDEKKEDDEKLIFQLEHHKMQHTGLRVGDRAEDRFD